MRLSTGLYSKENFFREFNKNSTFNLWGFFPLQRKSFPAGIGEIPLGSFSDDVPAFSKTLILFPGNDSSPRDEQTSRLGKAKLLSHYHSGGFHKWEPLLSRRNLSFNLYDQLDFSNDQYPHWFPLDKQSYPLVMGMTTFIKFRWSYS